MTDGNIHDLDGLRRCSVSELEALYHDSATGPAPDGRYRGTMLAHLDNDARRHVTRDLRWLRFHRIPRLFDRLVFGKLPFGVDFECGCWWFVRPSLRMGRFDVSCGPSRWRSTETLRLTYQSSLLPLRGILYDEVKPLTSNLCLGIGGTNVDDGDHFFFALVGEAVASSGSRITQ